MIRYHATEETSEKRETMKPKAKPAKPVYQDLRKYPVSTAPVSTAPTLPDATLRVLRASLKLTRETIQTVKPSLNDAQAFALYVLCEFADLHANPARKTPLAIEHLQRDFHVRVSSDEQIHVI